MFCDFLFFFFSSRFNNKSKMYLDRSQRQENLCAGFFCRNIFIFLPHNLVMISFHSATWKFPIFFTKAIIQSRIYIFSRIRLFFFVFNNYLTALKFMCDDVLALPKLFWILRNKFSCLVIQSCFCMHWRVCSVTPLFQGFLV